MDRTTHPRLDAVSESGAVVVRLFGNLFELSTEITAAAARTLAGELIESAEYLEANGHVED